MAVVLKTECSGGSACVSKLADGSIDVWYRFIYLTGSIWVDDLVLPDGSIGGAYRYPRGPAVGLYLVKADGSHELVDTYDFPCTPDPWNHIPCLCLYPGSWSASKKINIPADLVGACCALPVFFITIDPFIDGYECGTNGVVVECQSAETMAVGVQSYGNFTTIGLQSLDLCATPL